jgi:hypothetical protein
MEEGRACSAEGDMHVACFYFTTFFLRACGAYGARRAKAAGSLF